MGWWSDKPALVTTSWEIFSGTLADMWPINDVLLQVIRVGDFIICVKPSIIQKLNTVQFNTVESVEIIAETRVLLLHPA